MSKHWDLGGRTKRKERNIYYKYAPYGSKTIVLYYVDVCVYWYTYEALGKWSVDTLGTIFHVNFLGYAHWFMSIRLSQIKDHYIYVYLQNTWILI